MEVSDNAAASVNAVQEQFKLKVVPILVAIGLGVGIFLLSFFSIEIVKLFAKLPERPQMPWIVEYYEHFFLLVYALVAIRIVGKHRPADYGLHMPQGKSYVGTAVKWGLVFGVVMMLVDYWPNILAHKPPSDKPYPLTPINIAGWLSFEGVFVGPSEETLFRGLLVTYLAQAMPGRVSWRGYTMNGAGVVVAVLFALAHVFNFLTEPLLSALGQQVYAFAIGIFYAYWFEKSRSLLAPVVGHNVGNATEYVLIFALVALWG